MSTTTVGIDGDWTNVQSGPVDSISIQSTSREVQYRLEATEPAAKARGHILNPEIGHTIQIVTGENLYVRSSDGGSTQLIMTV